jgi:transposase-like protein
MKQKRRHLTPEFKACIAIEALQGIKTINEIAQANELAPTQVSQWKKELEGRVPESFAGKNHASPQREAGAAIGTQSRSVRHGEGVP